MRYVWKSAVLKIMNGKCGTFILVMLIFSRSYVEPLKVFCKSMDTTITWCIFPFLLTNNIFLCLFWFGIIYIHSDIPFLQRANMYAMVRSGRKKYFLAQIAGMFFRSAAVIILIEGLALLPVTFYVSWTNEWGKAFRTLAMTDAYLQYGILFEIPYEIFVEYTPLQVMGLTIVILIFIAWFMGILMYLIAVYINRVMAVAASTLLCIMFFVVQNVPVSVQYKFARVIPTIWGKLVKMKTPDLGYYWMPSVRYMICFLIGGGFLFSVFIWIKLKRMEIEWVNEDI